MQANQSSEIVCYSHARAVISSCHSFPWNQFYHIMPFDLYKSLHLWGFLSGVSQLASLFSVLDCFSFITIKKHVYRKALQASGHVGQFHSLYIHYDWSWCLHSAFHKSFDATLFIITILPIYQGQFIDDMSHAEAIRPRCRSGHLQFPRLTSARTKALAPSQQQRLPSSSTKHSRPEDSTRACLNGLPFN